MPLPVQPRIDTQRLHLRLVEKTDIGDLFAINGDAEVTHFLPYASWQGHEDGEAWYTRMATLNASGTGLQFVIVKKSSGQVIGTCLLFRLEETSARAEIGYVMGRAHWRRGFTREALSGLIGFAFHECALRRLEAEVDPHNAPSNQLLQTLGFVREGLLRQRWHAKDRTYDTNIYGLLHNDWTPEA